jgi:hypothetical protein
MKSAFDRPSVDAVRPPMSTLADDVNVTPFGFRRKTRPLDESSPWISDGSEPMMRFNASESVDGCTKVTRWPAPMSNEFQSIARRARP